jgi:hypothetical protein
VKKQFINGIALSAVWLLSLLFFSNNTLPVHAQPPPATKYASLPTTILTSTLTEVPTTTLTVSPASQELLTSTYTEVLQVAKDAVEEVHNTANQMLTWVGLLFTALSLVGVGGAWLLSTYAQKASQKASDAQREAANAHDLVQQLEIKSEKLEERLAKATEDAEGLSKRVGELLSQITSAHADLDNLRISLSQTKTENERDRQAIKRPLALMQIDDYAMRLFADDVTQRNSAILALLEMSQRDDAIIRRRCVKVFGALGAYDERIARRLKDMIANDKAGGVRAESEEALRKLESKRSY